MQAVPSVRAEQELNRPGDEQAGSEKQVAAKHYETEGSPAGGGRSRPVPLDTRRTASRAPSPIATGSRGTRGNAVRRVTVGVITVGVLLDLSGTLVIGTLFSNLDAAQIAIWLAVAMVASAAAAFAALKITAGHRAAAGPSAPPVPPPMSAAERLNWRMPPLTMLKPVPWSPGTKLGVLLLRGYLVVSVVLLVVKAIQLGGG